MLECQDTLEKKGLKVNAKKNIGHGTHMRKINTETS